MIDKDLLKQLSNMIIANDNTKKKSLSLYIY